MVITVTCPSCSSSFPVDSAKIPEGGVNARCTACSEIFRIEKPVEPEPIATFDELAPSPVETSPEPEPAPEAVIAPEPEPELHQEPAVEEAAPALVDSPEDWVIENEEVPPMAPGPTHSELTPPAPTSDPFGEAAPFEEAAPVAEAPTPTAEPLPAPPVVEAPAEEEAPAAGGIQGFTFGKRDPTDKARRLARVLVSDMIMYNAERHQSALAGGTLKEDFQEEIDKSWKEYVDQVGDELAEGPGGQFWSDALNDILAKGEQVF